MVDLLFLFCINCCSHCLLGFCVCFLLPFLVLQSSHWERKIRIHHEYEGWIEKSVPRIPAWHHETSRDFFCGSFFSIVLAMPLCTSIYMCLVVTCWKGLTSWLSFVVSKGEFVTFPLVPWVRCGTLLYRFLIFVPLLTLSSVDKW